MADGITEVTGLEHIDRGYENIVDKLKGLGANIWREQMTKQEIEEMKNA
ncbi:UDP-N-acetylglucosamine 1-carboxyvinyltransferase 2 [Streptococcus pneumoniae]|nr:UDP-N-acetylglucosamine 1-carboxyvinyltransferase [Bacillus altitudinis]COF48047.1 UDP-N-acetylglucosamine 1-carboxyvinyltransferase 2 [Streptococcus pneumoniae]